MAAGASCSRNEMPGLPTAMGARACGSVALTALSSCGPYTGPAAPAQPFEPRLRPGLIPAAPPVLTASDATAAFISGSGGLRSRRVADCYSEARIHSGVTVAGSSSYNTGASCFKVAGASCSRKFVAGPILGPLRRKAQASGLRACGSVALTALYSFGKTLLLPRAPFLGLPRTFGPGSPPGYLMAGFQPSLLMPPAGGVH